MDPIPGLTVYRLNFGGMSLSECRRFGANPLLFGVVLVLKLIRKTGPCGVFPGRLVEKPCGIGDFNPVVAGVLARFAGLLETAGFRRQRCVRLSVSMPGMSPDGGMLRALHEDGMRFASIGIVPTEQNQADFNQLFTSANLQVGVLWDAQRGLAVTNSPGMDPTRGTKLVLLRNASLNALLDRLDAELRKIAGQPHVFADLDAVEALNAASDAITDADRVRRGLYGRVTQDETRAYFAQCLPR